MTPTHPNPAEPGVLVLLGQVNFFLEFDVCFHQHEEHFEARARR